MSFASFPLRDARSAFGLSFVPPEALGPLAGGTRSPGRALAAAARELKAAFAFVPAGAPWAAEACAALRQASVAVFWAMDGPLWPVIKSYGVAEGLRATLLAPEAVAARLDEGLAELTPLIARGIELGASALVLAEDLAGSEGPLVAPDFAIDVLVPRFRGLVRAADEAGLPTVLHTDGDVRPLLAAIARAGFSGVHAGGGLNADGFERLFWAARRAGLMMLGGLQTVDLVRGLPLATALGSRLGVLAQAGGLLLADDGGLTDAAQLVALATALAAARTAMEA